ncbi:MAG: RNA-binding transcriptional accessory protein [Clostridia bacterium]|nr:RNA-binding transcriptional accessory protein [Clostridia bacterium]
MNILDTLTREFHLRREQTENTVKLLDDGCTVPFIARYRKEMTGSLDDQVIRELAERLAYLRHLEEERERVRAALVEQEVLTEELSSALDAAATLTEIEDIYRPYRPKRRTRASMAREKGLGPLADRIYGQNPNDPDPTVLAGEFITDEVPDTEAALQGAMDIIAETISDDAAVRKRLRNILTLNGELVSKATGEEDSVYKPYYDYKEPLRRVAGHRVLAINRGEREGFLKVSVGMEPARALNVLYSVHLKGDSPATALVRAAAEDAYDRLLFPSLEREIRSDLTDTASTAAIRVFSENLRQLLMQPPIRGRITLGLDPGYRNGCKAAVVDGIGRVLQTGVIYPVPPFNKIEEAKKIVAGWIEKYRVDIIAIGNGTASHETEVFVADLLKTVSRPVSYMVVSEAGASVYSASKLAAEEFPDYDVSLRSAVSIARRLQDPLAELVKIDPKSIGVGQYQHDMPQAQLSGALDGVVESCVNQVGVDLNTASAPLLTRISGLSASIAANIVAYREENGPFETRNQLKKVKKLGPKTFEQAAGFLRIPDSREMLDRTAVHPESYPATKALLKLCGIDGNGLPDSAAILSDKLKNGEDEKIAAAIGVGVPTLHDIAEELQRPGRDPRDQLPPPLLRTDILDIKDLTPGMQLTGTVRNIIDFGAFIDIGVHQDGLVHISQITDRFIRHPLEVLKVGDIVTVWVLNVDTRKNRIGLTMKPPKKAADA